MLLDLGADGPAELVAVMLKMYVKGINDDCPSLVCEGYPLIVPVVPEPLIDNPGGRFVRKYDRYSGRVPAEVDHVIGVAPVAVIALLYLVPATTILGRSPMLVITGTGVGCGFIPL